MIPTNAMLTFECHSCGHRFEAEGKLEEWTSAIYGPCQEYQAACPSCGIAAKEYRPKTASSGRYAPEACANGPCGEGPCSGGPCENGPCGGL
jgi:hypothetical protein